MALAEFLRIKPGITAVIGSGGKTTLLRTLGKELTEQGSTVLLCTTTKVFPFDGLTNLLSPSESELAAVLQKKRLVCAGKLLPDSGKLTMPEIRMKRLAELAGYVLVEADGSARFPLKAHAAHEPVIPPEANRTVCVVGLSGLGKPVMESVHRPEIFARLAGSSVETPATPEAVARVLNAERLADCYFLNQADTPEHWEWARRLAGLLNRPAVAGSLTKGVFFDVRTDPRRG